MLVLLVIIVVTATSMIDKHFKRFCPAAVVSSLNANALTGFLYYVLFFIFHMIQRLQKKYQAINLFLLFDMAGFILMPCQLLKCRSIGTVDLVLVLQ